MERDLLEVPALKREVAPIRIGRRVRDATNRLNRV